MNRFAMSLILLASLAGLTACDSIDNSIDCNQVCTTYSDCFDSDYDVESCTSKCEDNAGMDADFENKLETCESCIEDQSCTEATFECATSCVGIVP